jgi:predicted phage replisome organizer
MSETKSSFGKVKWIKLDPDVFNDEKIQLIESLPDGDTILILWFKLLALCGKANHGGLVTYVTLDSIKPYTDDMLVTLWKRKKSTVLLALDTFEQFGMIERLDNDAILVVNWEKYQNIAGLEQIREQNRLRKQKQRDREKQKLLEYKDTNMSRDMSRDVTQQNKNKNKKENKDILKEKYKKENVSAEADSTTLTKSDSFTKKEMLFLFEEFSLGDKKLFDTLIEFNTMRNKIRKPMTRKAVELLLNKLTKLSKEKNVPPTALLEQSIVNSWSSIYPIKQDFVDYKKSTKPDVHIDWLEDYIKEMEG